MTDGHTQGKNCRTAPAGPGNLRIGHYARVSRGRAIATASIVLFGIASTIWFASGTTTSRSDEASGRRFSVEGSRASVVIPHGWSAGPYAPYDGGPGAPKIIVNTARQPKSNGSLLECDRAAFTGLAVYIFEGSETDPWPPVVDRPSRFTARTGRMDAGDGDSCFTRTQFISITDAGRRFHAQVSIGRDVTKAETEAAYSILDSLRVKPNRSS